MKLCDSCWGDLRSSRVCPAQERKGKVREGEQTWKPGAAGGTLDRQDPEVSLPRSIRMAFWGKRRYQLQKLGDKSTLADHQVHGELELRVVSEFPSFPVSRDNMPASSEMFSKDYEESSEPPVPLRILGFLVHSTPGRRAAGHR